MSNKRHNHGQKAKVKQIRSAVKGMGDHVIGGFVLHPTKGYRKIRKVHDWFALNWLLKTGGYAE